MEIEFATINASRNRLGLTTAALLTAGLLLFLGYWFTAINAGGSPQVLTWSEWQVLKMERAYRAEVGRMQQDLSALAELVARPADPVRAQMAAARIARQYESGAPALARQREALITAAQVVQDWSVGLASLAEAQAAVQYAIQGVAVGAPEER